MNFNRPGAQHEGGDATLSFDLRCHYLGLADLVREAQQGLQQLQPLDALNSHDQEVDPELLARIGDWPLDSVGGQLTLAVLSCQKSVFELEAAHGHVAGLFKGTMRDNTEEALARALKGARASLEKLRAVTDEYELPKRPHEIRRNTISYLILECKKVAGNYDRQIAKCDEKVSADLKEQLCQIGAELHRMTGQFELLRERCSQKMTRHLEQCVSTLEVLLERALDLELDAGLKAGIHFGDYSRRTADRKAKRAA